MTGTVPRWEAAIGASLAQCARSVASLGRGRWLVGLANGKPFDAHARLENGWIALEARPALASAGGLAWELLALNETICGGSKLTLPPHGAALALRADVPAWDDAVVTRRLAEACRSMEEAFGYVGNAKVEPPSPGAAAAEVEQGEKADTESLAHLLSEAGWTRAERKGEGEGEGVAVQLDVPGAFYRASVAARPRGEVRIGVEIVAAATFPPVVRRAFGRMLLVSTGLVRLVRASAATTDAGDAARLEVSFRSSPSAAELDLALEALSVACRACGREARALARVEVASAYLTSIKG